MKARIKKTEIILDGIKYKKSSFSMSGKYCVGVNISDTKVCIINTKIQNSTVVEFTHEEWQAFLLGVKNNEFEINQK